MPGRGLRMRAKAGLCLAMTAALLASCGPDDQKSGSSSEKRKGDGASESVGSMAGSGKAGKGENGEKGGKPNIVYVLTDDLSWNLVKYMPHVREMMEKGTTFSNFFATDSLCCPSRSSIFTGQFPHNTGVFTNNGKDGGYGAYKRNGNAKDCFAPSLKKAGYRTGFMGKYMNGYRPAAKKGKPKHPVPGGWDEWDGAGDAYKQYDYELNHNGHVERHGDDPKDYLTDVLAGRASSFVDSSAKTKKPFMLEVAPFAPHPPATPAPRDEDKYPSVKAPRTEAFGKLSSHPPKWQTKLKPVTSKGEREIDTKFGKRVRSVLAVDKMIGDLQDQLKAKGLADDTYFVFGSDNGFHMGEHRLLPGKQTPYDTDTKVPMMVTGPGVPAGKRVPEMAGNVDVNPTFLELAGVKRPSSVDGRSLVDLMRGKRVKSWREAVLVEHHHAEPTKSDPDAAPESHGNPPDYNALRTADFLYVEYAGGDSEYYSLKSDPEQLKNRVSELSKAKRAKLHNALNALKHCKGSESCRKASRISD